MKKKWCRTVLQEKNISQILRTTQEMSTHSFTKRAVLRNCFEMVFVLFLCAFLFPAPFLTNEIQGLSNVPWRKRAFGPGAKYVSFELFLGAFLGPCAWGRGRPWYGSFGQPESHFIRPSARCAPQVVPSTFLLNYFGHSKGAWGGERGASLVRYVCKTHRSLHGRHV